MKKTEALDGLKDFAEMAPKVERYYTDGTHEDGGHLRATIMFMTMAANLAERYTAADRIGSVCTKIKDQSLRDTFLDAVEMAARKLSNKKMSAQLLADIRSHRPALRAA